MCLLGPVNPVQPLGQHIVGVVLHLPRSDVIVIVAAFTVLAKAVGMLHPEVQALQGGVVGGRGEGNPWEIVTSVYTRTMSCIYILSRTHNVRF